MIAARSLISAHCNLRKRGPDRTIPTPVRSLTSLVRLYAIKGDPGRANEYQTRISASEAKDYPIESNARL